MHFLVYFIVGLVFFGFMERLRGGAYDTLLNLHMGTQVTRIVTSFILSLYIIFGLWLGDLALHFNLINALRLLGITASLTLGYIIAGWAPFQGMNNTVGIPGTEKSYLEFIPNLIFKKNTVKWKFTGMAFAGIACVLPTTLMFMAEFGVSHGKSAAVLSPVFGGAVFNFSILFMVLIGTLFAPAYLLARVLNLPINKFTDEQMTWGEVFSGMVIGATFMIGLKYLI